MKKIYLLVLLVMFSLFIVACGETKTEEQTAIITIYVEDEVFEGKILTVGSKLDFELGDSSYLFLGWYDSTYTTCLDNTVITGDMNIYAKTIEKGTKYKINYHLTDTANFRGINYPRTYAVGEVTKLVNPGRPYSYEFTGWYYNGELITEISDTMYGEIDLYDSWVDNNVYHKITYVDDGATSYSSEKLETIMEGFEYQLPYPIKEGYFFNGWYTDSEYTNRIYALDETLKSDITLYAKYSEKTKANTYVSFMGDSISTYHGYIPEDAGAYYPTFLDFPAEQTYFLLTCSGMGFNFLKNNSYSGSRLTSNVVSNGVTLPSALQDTRINGICDENHDPDILIVHLGTNDYSQGIDKYTFQSCIGRFVTKIRAKYDDIEIYFCLHPYNGYGENYVKIREEFNEVIVEESKPENYNYGIIDLTQAWGADNYQTYIFSNAHPSVAGFKAMADCIIEELSKTHTYN